MGATHGHPCPTDFLDAVIAKLSRMPKAGLSENQRWHVRDAIESLRVAQEEHCLKPLACGRCDAQCGDLSQP